MVSRPEVNPRFSLWHHPAAVAGVNLPAAVYRYLTSGSFFSASAGQGRGRVGPGVGRQSCCPHLRSEVGGLASIRETSGGAPRVPSRRSRRRSGCFEPRLDAEAGLGPASVAPITVAVERQRASRPGGHHGYADRRELRATSNSGWRHDGDQRSFDQVRVEHRPLRRDRRCSPTVIDR